MPAAPGEKTGQFGLWLTEYIHEECADRDYLVYYDHGDPAQHDNVRVIKGFIGEKVKNENRLADIDVLVANRNREILLLIEIEESPISPKTLLGDVFASVFSTKFAVFDEVEQKYFYPSSRTSLIIAGYQPGEKKRLSYHNSVYGKLNEFAAPAGGISLKKVEFIIHEDLMKSLDNLRQRVIEIL